jgi:hypothetical protein
MQKRPHLHITTTSKGAKTGIDELPLLNAVRHGKVRAEIIIYGSLVISFSCNLGLLIYSVNTEVIKLPALEEFLSHTLSL